jgi:hypothetical protein
MAAEGRAWLPGYLMKSNEPAFTEFLKGQDSYLVAPQPRAAAFPW